MDGVLGGVGGGGGGGGKGHLGVYVVVFTKNLSAE